MAKILSSFSVIFLLFFSYSALAVSNGHTSVRLTWSLVTIMEPLPPIQNGACQGLLVTATDSLSVKQQKVIRLFNRLQRHDPNIFLTPDRALRLLSGVVRYSDSGMLVWVSERTKASELEFGAVPVLLAELGLQAGSTELSFGDAIVRIKEVWMGLESGEQRRVAEAVWRELYSGVRKAVEETESGGDLGAILFREEMAQRSYFDAFFEEVQWLAADLGQRLLGPVKKQPPTVPYDASMNIGALTPVPEDADVFGQMVIESNHRRALMTMAYLDFGMRANRQASEPRASNIFDPHLVIDEFIRYILPAN